MYEGHPGHFLYHAILPGLARLPVGTDLAQQDRNFAGFSQYWPGHATCFSRGMREAGCLTPLLLLVVAACGGSVVETPPPIPTAGGMSAGRCTAIDLRATDITRCKTAADCVLRSGTACCASCGDTPVAIKANGEAELEQLVCGSEPSECGSHCSDFTDLGVDCTAVDRPERDLALLPAPHCVVVGTSSHCTEANPCWL
jgi:hypothetical protein